MQGYVVLLKRVCEGPLRSRPSTSVCFCRGWGVFIQGLRCAALLQRCIPARLCDVLWGRLLSRVQASFSRASMLSTTCSCN